MGTLPNTTFDLAKTAFGKFRRATRHLQSPALLAVRLVWGWQFFQTGWGKLQNLDRTTEFFADLNLPFPHLNAIIAGSAECFGGLLLLLGLAARLAALPLIFTMIVAYLTAEIDSVKSLFTDPDQFLSSDPLPFLLASLIILAFGPGALSIDAIISRAAGQRMADPAPDSP